MIALLAAPAASPALSPTRPLREYGQQSWQTESGLPQNTVHAVLQTRDGFLWIATEGGLVRFDGQDLLTFDTANTPELHSNLINDLAEDDRGTLWIATADGLLALTPDPLHPRFTRYTTADGLPANLVRSVLKRPGGGLLLLTAAGAALVLPDSGRLQPLAGLAPDTAPDHAPDLTAALVTAGPHDALWIAANRQILALAPGATAVTPIFSAAEIPAAIGDLQTIAATSDGDLWIGGHTGLALLSRTRKPMTLHPAPSSSITALLPQPGGGLWVGTDAGLLSWAHGAFHRAQSPDVDAGSTISTGRVLSLFPDREGALWIAYDRGLARIPHAASFKTSPSLPPALPAPALIPGVLSIFEDREGDMWFGTDTGGLTVLREQAFSTLTTADGLSGDFVRTVFEDHAGTRWIGTNRGLDSLRAGKLSPLPGLDGSIVLALAETSAGLWIGTPDGLYRLHAGRLTHLTTADGLPDDFVRSLYADADGSLWIGTRNGLAHLDPARSAHYAFTTYSRLDGLGSDVIGTILRTHSGTLWVGTLGGLSRLDGSRFRNYTHDANPTGGLSGDAITTLHEDRQGTLWIAAHDAGLTRLHNGVFTALHPPPGSLPEEIFSILEDTGDSLWLGSRRGIYRVGIESLNALADHQTTALPSAVFNAADGMKISECSSGGHPAGWRMQDGSLWFSTLKGVAMLQPGSGFDNPVPPLTAIEQVLIDGPFDGNQSTDGATNPTGHPAASTRSGTPLTLAPGTAHLTLHYAGLSFASPQKIHFRYKLEGFDHDWIDAGSRRTAFYTNLPPGSYRFLVYAANSDGIWSLTPAALPLVLQPRFYQTLWFLLLCGLALVAIGSLLYRSRLRFVAAQYQAVLTERTRIAREIHDTLAQGYVGISVQLELVSRLLQSSPEAAASQLENTKQLVRSALAEARSSIWNLRSPTPADRTQSTTLPLRIAADIEARRQSDGPAIRLDVRGATRSLDRSLEDEFLRVAQEAVANALRHAGARHIAITLSYDADCLRLQVADDGIGFLTPPGGFASSGHFGLKGMEERAAAIGARLQLRSARGRGTTLALICPLHPGRLPGPSPGPTAGPPSRRILPTPPTPPPTPPLHHKEAL